MDDFKFNPPDCACVSFPFTENLVLHDITGDLNIINKSAQQNVLINVSKYREPKSINWKQN